MHLSPGTGSDSVGHAHVSLHNVGNLAGFELIPVPSADNVHVVWLTRSRVFVE